MEWHPRLNNKERLYHFARAVNEVGGGEQFWGFIDGTFRGIQRPGRRQEDWYSGHYKSHGFKFQAITTPDGLVSSLCGPHTGPRNDWHVYNNSVVPNKLRQLRIHRGVRLYLYGDLAYSQRFGIMAPHQVRRGRRYLNERQQQFNRQLSTSRIAVEHAFGQTQSLWTYTAFQLGLCLGKQPIAAF